MNPTLNTDIKALQHLSELLNEFNAYFSSIESSPESGSYEWADALSKDLALNKKLSLSLDENILTYGGQVQAISKANTKWIDLIKGVNGCSDPQDLFIEVKSYILKRYEEYREKIETDDLKSLIETQSTELAYSLEDMKSRLKAKA